MTETIQYTDASAAETPSKHPLPSDASAAKTLPDRGTRHTEGRALKIVPARHARNKITLLSQVSHHALESNDLEVKTLSGKILQSIPNEVHGSALI